MLKYIFISVITIFLSQSAYAHDHIFYLNYEKIESIGFKYLRTKQPSIDTQKITIDSAVLEYEYGDSTKQTIKATYQKELSFEEHKKLSSKSHQSFFGNKPNKNVKYYLSYTLTINESGQVVNFKKGTSVQSISKK